MAVRVPKPGLMVDQRKPGVTSIAGVGVFLALLLGACGPAAGPEASPTTMSTPPPAAARPAPSSTPLAMEIQPAPSNTALPATLPASPIGETPVVPPTPTPPASATPVLPLDTATPLPGVSLPSGAQDIVLRAQQDLAQRLNQDGAAIAVVSSEAVEWPDASLGCPQPGLMYVQVVTPGYLVVLEAEGKRYEYHTSRDELVLCEPQEPVSTATESPVGLELRPWLIAELGLEVTVPAGFRIDVFADGLLGPRFMALSPAGELFVAERGARRVVALPDRDGDGRSDDQIVIADNLDAPSSLAFREDALYVGETTQITRLVLDADWQVVERQVAVSGLPGGRGHSTRTVVFGSDGQMYVSVGSSCNVCLEDDPRRAAVSVYPPQGGEGRVYAVGLRNAVGLVVNPWTGSLWATNNGRDRMGDDVPPETVYVVRDGADYGWPRCHAADIADPDFGEPDGCDGVEAPVVRMQAHSAPLGIAFYDGEQFPSEYRDNAYIAFHGSWNRTIPTGYKVVRVPVEGDRAAGPVQDFAAGWLGVDGSVRGRPVGVTVGADGSLYVSDDQMGLIYRISYEGR
jgi:glucose/arabinose dehydrogenase